MTVRTVFSISRPDTEVSKINKDSGVVTKICGGNRFIAALSIWLVSPVRVCALMTTPGKAASNKAIPIPDKGCSRFLLMSFDKAFNGDTYNTWHWSGKDEFKPCLTNWSITAKKAAKVLPEPVGAAIKADCPAWMAGQAWHCTSEGKANWLRNQSAITGWNVFSAGGIELKA